MRFNKSLITTILSIFIVNTFYSVAVCEDSNIPVTKTVPAKAPPKEYLASLSAAKVSSAFTVTTTATVTVNRAKTVISNKTTTTSSYVMLTRAKTIIPNRTTTTTKIKTLRPGETTKAPPRTIPRPKTAEIPTPTTTLKALVPKKSTPSPYNEVEIAQFRSFCDGETDIFVYDLYNYVCLREVITVVDGEYILNEDNDYLTDDMPCMVINEKLYCIDNTDYFLIPCREHYVSELSLDRCLIYIGNLLDLTIYDLVIPLFDFAGKGRYFVNPNRPNWYPYGK